MVKHFLTYYTPIIIPWNADWAQWRVDLFPFTLYINYYQAVCNTNIWYADVSVILRTHTGGVFKEYNEEVTTATGVTGTYFSCACKVLT